MRTEGWCGLALAYLCPRGQVLIGDEGTLLPPRGFEADVNALTPGRSVSMLVGTV
jgi:hypothetical protein